MKAKFVLLYLGLQMFKSTKLWWHIGYMTTFLRAKFREVLLLGAETSAIFKKVEKVRWPWPIFANLPVFHCRKSCDSYLARGLLAKFHHKIWKRPVRFFLLRKIDEPRPYRNQGRGGWRVLRWRGAIFEPQIVWIRRNFARVEEMNNLLVV